MKTVNKEERQRFDPREWSREARCTAAEKSEKEGRHDASTNNQLEEMTTSAKRTFLDFHAAPEPPTGPRPSRPHIFTASAFFAMAHYGYQVTVSE